MLLAIETSITVNSIVTIGTIIVAMIGTTGRNRSDTHKRLDALGDRINALREENHEDHMKNYQELVKVSNKVDGHFAWHKGRGDDQ